MEIQKAMRILRPTLTALLLLLLQAATHAQTTQKVACTPCEDYYGMGGHPPAAAIAIIPDTVPGLMHFTHVEDPDTGTWYIAGVWSFVHDTTIIHSLPGDTVSHQFPANGVYELYFDAAYGTPRGGCPHYNHIFITISNMPQAVVAAAPPTETAAKAVAYPNPTPGTLHIDGLSAAKGPIQARLHDPTGRLAYWAVHAQREHLELDLHDLPAGTFLLTLVQGGASTVHTIVKQ